MEFIGRKTELAIFEREYRRSGGFLVLYGRRRVGKTALIKEFVKNKPALYFLASQETEVLNRRRFARDVAAFANDDLIAQGEFDDWRPLFQRFARCETGEKKVLVIDELPYLVKVNPAFVSILQYAWDEILKDSHTMLIVCGSSTHMMQTAALSYESPLYGRRTAQMKLLPLSFHELRTHFSDAPFKRLMELYAVTGGVPKYVELVGDGFFEQGGLQQFIRETVLSPSGFLHEEPRFLLDQEVDNPTNYFSIMSVVARGGSRSADIARMMGKPAGEISPYLKVLLGLGYLNRRVPFNEKKPQVSKNGLYVVADEFIDFWFKYVWPYAGELEMGNEAPSLAALSATFQSNKVPFAFEKICRQGFARMCVEGEIAFSPMRVEGYWSRRGDLELDVCALESDDEGFDAWTQGGESVHPIPRMFAGECKYHAKRPFSAAEFNELVRKVSLLPAAQGKDVIYGLFSATGFDKELAERAEGDKRLVLVNECRVVGQASIDA